MANIKDIAKACGLSVATVSRVFNEPQKVSPKTRALVLETAEKLNFSLNRVASALRSGRSKSIGVLVPFINNHVFASAIKAMEELVDAGLVRKIGVCNLTTGLLRDVLSYARIKPEVLQVELHPFLTQEALLRFCREEEIAVTAFSPFGADSYLPLGMAGEDERLLLHPVI